MKLRDLTSILVIASLAVQLRLAAAHADDQPPTAAAASDPDTTAPAGPTVTSKADIRAASKHFQIGKRLAAKHQYPAAISEFEQAYALDPRNEHLYNLAVAHQLDANRDQAIAYYRRYLAVEPTGKLAADARRFLSALEAKAAAEQAQRELEAQAARKEEEAKHRVATAEREAQQAKAEASAALARATEAEAALQAERAHPSAAGSSAGGRRGESLRLAGVGLGVAGVAGLVSGIYFAARSQRLSDELSKVNAVYYPDKVSDGESADRAMVISFIAGGVLTAAGVTTFYLGRAKGKERPRAALVPTARPDGGALVVSGAW